MSNYDRRALFEALKSDAARMGITVPELIKRITSGAQVIGAGQDREMIDPATYMDTGSGHMPQIRDRQVEPEDDFEQLVRERSEALEEAGGDDLAREVIMREKNFSALSKEAPFTRTAPVSVQNATLGRQITITGTATNQGVPVYTDPSEICAWVGDDADTRPVTATFGPIPFSQPRNRVVSGGVGPQALRPMGRILFGTSGYLNSADLDIINGCQLTVNASQVRLQVLLAGPNDDLVFTGMLSFQPCVRTAPLYCTRYFNQLDGGGFTGHLRIPPFAKKLVVRRRNAAVSYTIAFENTNQNDIYTITVGANAECPVMEVPGDGFTFGLTNILAPGTMTDFDFVFELGL